MNIKVNRNRRGVEYTFPIVIELLDDTEGHKSELAAATYITDPTLKRKYKLSKSQVEELDELVSDVLHVLQTNAFNILAHYQSNRSYVYYIRFIPTDESGDEWEYPAEIQFELRDHRRNAPINNSPESNLYIQVFHVGNKDCFDTSGVLAEVKKVCKQLKQGDYSSLR